MEVYMSQRLNWPRYLSRHGQLKYKLFSAALRSGKNFGQARDETSRKKVMEIARALYKAHPNREPYAITPEAIKIREARAANRQQHSKQL
jgi:hypothetical protein